MINQELVSKYKRALDLCKSDDSLQQYIQTIRETLYKLLQSDYTATIDEVIWAECFINRERFSEDSNENKMMVLRNFNDENWNTFKGAEVFADFTQPMTATRTFDEWEVTLVVDNSGIHLYLTSVEEEWLSVIPLNSLHKRFKVAIGNEICNTIETCLSKSGLVDKLRTQLSIEFERGD